MRALKIVAAAVWLFIVLVCALPMLGNLVTGGPNPMLGLVVWLVMAGIAWLLVHLVVVDFAGTRRA